MIEKYEKAGRIAAEVLAEGKRLAKPGLPLLELAEKLESLIREKGAKPAFPVNLSINDIAAHYTPEHQDKAVIGEKDLLKIDVGAQIDGFIGDTAATVDFSGENGKLLEASQLGLDAAISCVKAGAKTADVGAAVEAAIKAQGFRPIENLTGHSLAQYDLHAGIEVPNIRTPHSHTLKEGDFLAIEPFATTGAGRVGEGTKVEIYSLLSPKLVRGREARRLQAHVAANYRTLPFAERWLYPSFKSKLLLNAALRELILSEALHQYPVLREVKSCPVSQAEVTVVVEKDSARILTK
jgi:methionyl aminopeptidase